MRPTNQFVYLVNCPGSPEQARHGDLLSHLFGTAVLNEAPDAIRRERKVHRLHVEMAQGRRNGVGQDAADRNRTAFAGAFRAEWMV